MTFDTMDWEDRRKLSSDKMFAKKLFIKTGCLMTADGSDDDMITPQGLEPYKYFNFFYFISPHCLNLL